MIVEMTSTAIMAPSPETKVRSITFMESAGMTDIAAAARCLPPEVERLLLDVMADGFTVYCCGSKALPTALVAVYEWPQCIDLITIRDFDRVTAARTPKRGNVDIFAPEVVMWAYEGPPQWTLQVLLNLVHPQHPDAPHGEYPAPPRLHIRRAEQHPMTIRLPTPGKAGARARRLAASLPQRLMVGPACRESRCTNSLSVPSWVTTSWCGRAAATG